MDRLIYAENVDAVPMSWLEERSKLADSELIRTFLKALILAWKEEQKEKHEALNTETKNMNDTIGARLRSARYNSGLSADAAAEKVGVTRWAINAWERDDNIPSGYNIISLCKTYNVSSDWILFGKEWRTE